MKRIQYLFFFVYFIFICSCGDTSKQSELIEISSGGSMIPVKIHYPSGKMKQDKIIVWSTHSTENKFFPDSINFSPDSEDWIYEIHMSPILMDSLLQAGFINIEYLGRNDSIMLIGRKFRESDIYTKALDLEAVLDYLRSRKEFQKKKIVLAGYSEGGDINAVVASRQPEYIDAVVQLAISCVDGKTLAEYQELNNTIDFFFRYSAFMPEMIDSLFNRVTSLKEGNYEHSVEGLLKFKSDTRGPLNNIIYQYDNRDSIADQMIVYLQSKWNRENEETRQYHGNFETYCKENFLYEALSPQQIMLRQWQPDLYYPKITCPVLAVFGKNDKRIEYSSSKEGLERSLAQGGNTNYKIMVLDGYDHSLVKNRTHIGHDGIESSVIAEIVDWVIAQ